MENSKSTINSFDVKVSESVNHNGEIEGASGIQNPSFLSTISSPQYENVSDVESINTDSEGEVKEEEDGSVGEAMTAAKFLSSVYFEPSVVNHSEKRLGVLEALTHSSVGKALETANPGSDDEEPVPEDFHETDCEDCQDSDDSDSDCLAISESGLQRYLEVACCHATSDTAESCKEGRRVSDISDMEDGDWMEMDEEEQRKNSDTETIENKDGGKL